MKVPAPGETRGRAATSTQQLKSTAPTSENPSPLVYVLLLGLPPVINGTRPIRALLEILAVAMACAVTPATKSTNRTSEHQRRAAV